MDIPKKRCAFCHHWYAPDPRTRRHQMACEGEVCRKKRKAQADKSWRIRHPGYGEKRKCKIRAWATGYPNYWRQYRTAHPAYVERDNRRRVLSAQRTGSSAKQVAIRQISLDKLRSIQGTGVTNSAKQDAIHRRVNGIVEYLFWKESSAKPNAIALATLGGVG